MSYQALARYCTCALIAVLLAPSLRAQQPAAPTTVTRAYTIFLRGTPVGREDLTVKSDATGLTITSQSSLGAPLNIVMRKGEVVYRPDLTPASMTLDASINAKDVTLKTTFANGSAVTEGNDAGTPIRNTMPIQPRTFVMPDIFFGAIEGLGRQLSRLNGLPDDIHAFVAPGVDVAVKVTDASRGRMAIGTASFDVYRYELVFSNATGQLAGSLTTEINGGFITFSLPAQALEVVRDDLSTSTARTLMFANPSDEPATIAGPGFNLAATVTRPRIEPAPARAPAVIVLGGSGSQERDGYVGGIPVMGQLAGALADAGFLVVRFDRRGAGQSGGRPESVTLSDLAEDVRIVAKWLADRKDVDPKRIAVVGHSEAAWVALLSASRDNRVAAVVSLAAPSQTGADLVLEQQRIELDRLNLSPAEREAKVALQKKIQAAVVSGTGWEGVPADLRRQADTPWFESLLSYDPAKVLERVRQPLLFVHGQLDKQIPVAHVDRLAEIARKSGKSKVIDVVAARGVNHLLVPAVTGEISEYGTLTDRKVSRDVTKAISDWLTRTLPTK